LADAIKDLMADDQARKALSENILKMALPDADERIADAAERIINAYNK
jgi:UDP-N-acetylglucosamine:LPS N-acetylglucosamine transferase